MRGRGLLIAAAVLQLAGAAMALISSVSMFGLSATPHFAPVRALAAVDLALASAYIAVSIFLLYRRRWAWIASLAMNSIIAALFLAMPLVAVTTHGGFGVGFGEMIILLFIAAPLFVTIGLLIGARPSRW
jgi:hypothetical protein